MLKALREFTLVHAMSAAQRQVAADLLTKPIGLNHKPACRLPVNYSHYRHISLKADTHFTVPQRVEGWVNLDECQTVIGWLNTMQYRHWWGVAMCYRYLFLNPCIYISFLGSLDCMTQQCNLLLCYNNGIMFAVFQISLIAISTSFQI